MRRMTTLLTAMLLSTTGVAAQNAASALSEASTPESQKAQNSSETQVNDRTTNLRGLADDTWVSLTGTVTTARSDSFELEHGGKTITVEMDDWDIASEGQFIKSGDQVLVSGRIDNDLFDLTTVEASSVYIENLGTHFMAPSAADEEAATLTMIPVIVRDSVTLSGTVNEVQENAFTIDAGTSEVTLNVADMAENPLDNEGFLQIDRGDRVIVNGISGPRFFADRTLDITTIIELDANPAGSEAVGSPDATGTTGEGAGASQDTNSDGNQSAAVRRSKAETSR